MELRVERVPGLVAELLDEVGERGRFVDPTGFHDPSMTLSGDLYAVATAARTSPSRSNEASTSAWSSARWRMMTSVQPIAPSSANAAATASTPPDDGRRPVESPVAPLEDRARDPLRVGVVGPDVDVATDGNRRRRAPVAGARGAVLLDEAPDFAGYGLGSDEERVAEPGGPVDRGGCRRADPHLERFWWDRRDARASDRERRVGAHLFSRAQPADDVERGLEA